MIDIKDVSLGRLVKMSNSYRRGLCQGRYGDFSRERILNAFGNQVGEVIGFARDGAQYGNRLCGIADGIMVVRWSKVGVAGGGYSEWYSHVDHMLDWA